MKDKSKIIRLRN